MTSDIRVQFSERIRNKHFKRWTLCRS